MQIQFPTLSQNSMPGLKAISFTFLSNMPVLLSIFVVFIVGYIIVSIVLFYHWSAYGMQHRGILLAEALYTAVSVVLLGVASLALHYF